MSLRLSMERTFTYSITLLPEPEGGFTVRVPALPEIVTYGEDEGDAVEMAREAIELVVESRRERGEYLPEGDLIVVHRVAVAVST